MNHNQLLHLRLASQQLTMQQFSTAKELVGYMGAMQAQDFSMSKWAIGIRTSQTEEEVINEINEGNILRTHVLRPTWHYIAADNIYQLLQLSSKAVKARMSTNNKKLGIDDSLFKKINSLIAKALEKNDNLNRDEIAALIQEKKIVTTENRMAHFLMEAELSGIICSGKIINNRHTYSLLENKIRKKNISQEEAAAMLATTYFQSHGPATVEDFIWWSGLAITKAKKAVQQLDSTFITETINDVVYYFKHDIKASATASVFMLPSYDELVISYKNRDCMFNDEAHKKVISSNGIFWPIIVINGKVAGQWSRKTDKKEVYIQTELFNKSSALLNKKINAACKKYGTFLQKKIMML